VTAEFFALAFTAAINPSLLGIDLLLIVNRRPTAMLALVLAGGMGMTVTIGLVDVLVIRSDLIKSQGGVGAGGDLAIGLLLTTIGGLILARRRSSQPREKKKQSADGWMQRALASPGWDWPSRSGRSLACLVPCT
jgi:hypothetical protein